MTETKLLKHPNSRGFYPTPVTLALSYRDYARYSPVEAAQRLSAAYPTITATYLADVLATVYRSSITSPDDLHACLPPEFQNDNTIDQAITYAYPALGTYSELGELTVSGLGYKDKFTLDADQKPHLIIRDSISDDKNVYASPDIIVSEKAVADYKTYYGRDNDADWNKSFNTGAQVESGKKSYLYVRIKNAGNTPVAPYISIWYLRLGTLVHFDQLWPVAQHFISKPLKADEQDVIEMSWFGPRQSGDFCFIAIAQSPRNPVIIPPEVTNKNVKEFVAVHDNVAWLNFKAVNIAPDQRQIKLPTFYVGDIPGSESKLALAVTKDSPLKALPPGISLQISAGHVPLDVVELDIAEQTQGLLIISPALVLSAETPIDLVLNLTDPLTDSMQIIIKQIADTQPAGSVTFNIDISDEVTQI
jgi:hypothetical protein